jgi:hypothetical protein
MGRCARFTTREQDSPACQTTATGVCAGFRGPGGDLESGQASTLLSFYLRQAVVKGKSLGNGGGVGEAGGVRRTRFFCSFLDFFVSFLLCGDPR